MSNIYDVAPPPPDPFNPMALWLWLLSVYVGESLAIITGALILKHFGIGKRRAWFISLCCTGVSYLVGSLFWILWEAMF